MVDTPSPSNPAPAPAAQASWPRETLAGGLGTLATLAVPLTLGMLAFAAMGPQAAAIGIPAALATTVVGGVVYGLAGRATLPVAGPSSATALILGGLVLRLSTDPAAGAALPGQAGRILALCGAVVMLSGLMQVFIALLGMARLARFVPQPVLAGFMNGVALLIALGQLPLLLGHTAGQPLAASLAAWQPAALALGVATAATVWALGRRWPRAPAALIALLLGTVAWHLLQAWLPGLGIGQAVGALGDGLPSPGVLRPLFDTTFTDLLGHHGPALVLTALALALVGTMESALNTVAVDRVRNTRHDPRRELLGIGLTNLVCGAFGSLPAVALRARANAVLQAGGQGAKAAVGGSVAVGALALAAGHLLGGLPLPVLAGIMLTVAFGLLDRWTHGLMLQWGKGERSRELQISLGLVALVCVVTVWQGFVAAVLAGMLLSMLVFIARMNRSLVRSRSTAQARPSHRIYPAALEARLQPLRAQVTVLELEGALFFGSSDRLLADAHTNDGPCRCLVLDLRRVGDIDETGVLALQQLQAQLSNEGTSLRLAGVMPDSPRSRALLAFGCTAACFPDVDRAVEAAERQLLGPEADATLAGMALRECSLLQGLDADDLDRVLPLLRARRLQAGETLFAEGSPADCLYVLSEGSASVVSTPQPGAPQQRYLSLSPGMMFGETAMFDGGGRTAAVVADVDAVVHALTRTDLDTLDTRHPHLGSRLHRNIALHLSQRLRSAARAWHASTR